MMNIEQINILQGNKIEILEMILKNVDNQLELSWDVYLNNAIFKMTFKNVSRFNISDFSLPLEIYGFEIVNHSQNGWEKDSAYEINDFEDGYINFFCESFNIMKDNQKEDNQGNQTIRGRFYD